MVFYEVRIADPESAAKPNRFCPKIMSERLEFAKEIAREAAAFTLKYFADPSLKVERKGDNSPVTLADKGAEQLLRKRIEEAFPDDAILGEEFPPKNGTSGFRWLLDPIDGTKSFIHGVPLYSTLIGVDKDNQSQLGIIALPALNEMIWAESGSGAFWETPRSPEPIRAQVSKTDSLSKSLFLTSEVISFENQGRGKAYKELESLALLTRTWGDAYGYFLVATGRADFMVDPIMGLWDAGPLQV
ncbi:MAG: inositol monophosphatase family protein, partial [Thermoguttaceae bacterium]